MSGEVMGLIGGIAYMGYFATMLVLAVGGWNELKWWQAAILAILSIITLLFITEVVETMYGAWLIGFSMGIAYGASKGYRN